MIDVTKKCKRTDRSAISDGICWILELDQAHTARRVIPIKYSGLPAGDWLVSSIVTFSKLSQPGTYTYLRV